MIREIGFVFVYVGCLVVVDKMVSFFFFIVGVMMFYSISGFGYVVIVIIVNG